MERMRSNYRYLLGWIQRTTRDMPRLRILDYGCGSGEVVSAGRSLGLEIWGVDVFYQGSTSRNDVDRQGLLGDVIREIRNGMVDFSDGYFDLVVSNQVFEHVEDLDDVMQEISRVMADNAMMLCLFPSRDVMREGHIGIPFVHWFSKGSRLRYAYALVLRSIGFGYNKGGKSRRKWVADQLGWLDRYTHYRQKREISRSISKYFDVSGFEDDYIRFRLTEKYHQSFIVPLLMHRSGVPLRRFLLHKFAGMVVLARKIPVKRNRDAA